MTPPMPTPPMPWNAETPIPPSSSEPKYLIHFFFNQPFQKFPPTAYQNVSWNLTKSATRYIAIHFLMLIPRTDIFGPAANCIGETVKGAGDLAGNHAKKADHKATGNTGCNQRPQFSPPHQDHPQQNQQNLGPPPPSSQGPPPQNQGSPVPPPQPNGGSPLNNKDNSNRPR
ncbi:unnamed protein product [Tuber aestivum]|uniref:Uncharacterized protein n=1 Tax=Tuber aestivum TaxID=59557 RepID=A0A292PTE0_9PEZI|nr:unnamed protein product [Tuber aestivum]